MNPILEKINRRLEHLREEKFVEDVNKRVCYIQSFLEDDFLYHTTTFENLKAILSENLLKPNEEGFIGFTSNPRRHLSKTPSFHDLDNKKDLIRVSLDTFIKIPFEFLKALGVKPMFYEFELTDLVVISEYKQWYYLGRFITEKEIDKIYGEEAENYKYFMWYVENEWRLYSKAISLPMNTEVYVANRRQLKEAKKLSKIPIFIRDDLKEIT